MKIGKLAFDRQHVALFFLAVVAGVLQTYEHSSLFGNVHPAAPSPATIVSWVILAATWTGAFLKQSPQDLYKVLTGELLPALLESEPPTMHISTVTPTIPPPAPTATALVPPEAPTLPDMHAGPKRGFARVGLLGTITLVSAVLTIFAFGASQVACDKPAQTAAVIQNLGLQVECIYTKTDPPLSETPQQAATDCGVGVNDVFQVLSLFDRRAAARHIVLDAGK